MGSTGCVTARQDAIAQFLEGSLRDEGAVITKRVQQLHAAPIGIKLLSPLFLCTPGFIFVARGFALQTFLQMSDLMRQNNRRDFRFLSSAVEQECLAGNEDFRLLKPIKGEPGKTAFFITTAIHKRIEGSVQNGE